MNPWLSIVTLAALIFYLFTGFSAGRARHRLGVPAPAMTGHPEFERAIRVQYNTLEWLVVVLPAMWLFGSRFDPRIAAGLGAIWIVGRVLYMTGYMQDAAKRGPGFAIQGLATLILLIGALAGAVMGLAAGGV